MTDERDRLLKLVEEHTETRGRLVLVEETVREQGERMLHVEGAQKDLATEFLRQAKWIREIDERSLEATKRADAAEHRIETVGLAMQTVVADGERRTNAEIAKLSTQLAEIPKAIGGQITAAVAAEIRRAGDVAGAAVSTAIATTKPAPPRSSPSQRATRIAVVVMVLFEVLRELARMKGWIPQ